MTYEASSGGLSCPDAMTRINYYGISAYPTIIFNGVDEQVGAPASDANGEAYAAIINNWLDVDTPLMVAITDFDWSSHVDVFLKLLGDEPSLTGAKLRVFIVEDHLYYGGDVFDHVVRDMLPEVDITITANGETQSATIPINMAGITNPTPNPANCTLVAIVQHNTSKTIYNASNSKAGTLRASVLGETQVFVDGPHTFGDVSWMHVGEPDVFDITLDTSGLPAGWSAFFTYDGMEYSSTTIPMDMLTEGTLNVTMIPDTDTVGQGNVELTFHSQNGMCPDVVLPFGGMIFEYGTEVLIIADDGPAAYAFDYYLPAMLAATTKTCAVWDLDFAALETDMLSNYEAVVWVSGQEHPSLEAGDRTALLSYMQGGGRVFLAGQDMLSDIFAEGGSASMWAQLYLRANLVAGGYTDNDVEGVDGDDISNGLNLTLAGGDGADNLVTPDVVVPINDTADQVFTWTAGVGAGIKTHFNGYKVVLLGFGLESIDNATDRQILMGNVIDWLLASEDSVDEMPVAKALYQNTPNPFNPKTTINYSLDREAPVRIEIFDIMGRMVRLLADEVRSAGNHEVVWDGCDNNGSQMASGTYFCRMISEGKTFNQKMTMLK